MKRVLTYATVCSGIECMSVACRGLPLRPVFFSEIEPFPCAVLKAHYPDVPNLGDMSKIQVSSGGLHITNGRESISLDKPLDILAGGTPCFAAGTMVLTPKGYVPIETLKVGDEVVTHRGRLRKILRVGSKIAETAEARIVSRPPMRCTLDHKFWSATKTHHSHDNHLVVDDCGFLEVEKNISGYVAQQRTYDIPMPDDFPVGGVTSVETVIELAGWYCGDGCIRSYKDRKNRAVVLCVNADKMAVLLERLGEKIHICQGNPDANGVFKAQICSTSLAIWLERHFGKLAHCKTVPAWLIAAPQNVRDAFIRGYLATDGCTPPNGTVSFTTVSKSLAYGVADILRDACVFYNDVPSRCVIQGREVSQRPFYIVRKNLHANRFHKHGDWAFVRVKSLANRRTEKVYQIEVEEDHSYVSNGIVSKNCQDVSVAGKRAGMSEGSGTRSSLAFDFVRLARELGPRYILWENVAGAIDSKNAPDFLAFLRALGDCGYSLAWRVLDAQYVRVDGMERAVPQRRRRVWVVGCLGADESLAGKILFEPDCVAGHTAPRRRAGEGFAYSLAGRDRVDAPVVGEPAADRDGGCLNPLDVQSKRIYQPSGSAPCLPSGSTEGMTIQPSVCIALDGDQLKPREALAVRTANTHANGHGVATEATHTLDGANGQGVAYKAKRTWWNGAEVATTTTTTGHNQLMPDKDRFDAVVECRDVAETIDSNYFKGQGSRQGVERPVAVQCYDMTHADDPGRKVAGGVSPTLQSRMDTGGNQVPLTVSMAQNTRDEVRIIGGDGQIAGALPAEPGMKQQTYVVSTNSNGLITKGSGEAILSDEHHMALQCGGGQCGQGTPACVISTNSNGGDVAATINANMSKLGGDNQTTFGGGYCIIRRIDV